MRASRSGILPVDKPEGPTSHDLVGMARRSLGTRRIGHTGTLDPFASGLLLLCVGWATRLAEYLTGLDKVYRAVARLGIITDTADLTGEVMATSEGWRGLSEELIEETLLQQLGEIDQVPPAYSAKRVAGVRAYDLARRGEEVRLPPVRVRIRRIEVVEIRGPDIEFEVECSSGTYIRSIARDLGEGLGVGAHLRELRRTAIGSFGVDSAISVEDLDDQGLVDDAWISPLDAVVHLPRVEVDEVDARTLSHGGRVERRATIPVGVPLAIARGDHLLAIGEGEDHFLRVRKVFQGD